MEPSKSPSSTTAAHPFDNTNADTILRSCDAVDFHVHSAILAAASSTFTQTFSLPQLLSREQPQDVLAEYKDTTRPMVVLPQESHTLDSFLRLLYPVADPVLDRFEHVRDVLETAMKYETKDAVATILPIFRSFASTYPLQTWAAAYRFGLENEARSAAQSALQLSILDEFPQDLYDLPAGVYYKLLDFHRKGGAVSDDFTFCDSRQSIIHCDSTENMTPTIASQRLMAIPAPEISSSTPSTAPSPFNNISGDVILRSIDSIDFRVHGVILSEASPFFKAMFSLRQPPSDGDETSGGQEYRDGCPVIVFTENSYTLDCLLRLCYPVADAALADLMDIWDVLLAARKYQMEEAIVLLTGLLRTFALTDPVRVWAVACILQQEPEARYAADYTLRLSQLVEFPQEMRVISAGTYFRLLQFHRLQGKVKDGFTFLCPIAYTPSNPMDTDRLESKNFAIPDFFSHPFADIICRSQDGVCFRVHKIIIFMASPILGKQAIAFTSPDTVPNHDADSATGDLPIIDIPLLSCTLAVLLRLCYPNQEACIVPEDLSVIQALLQAAILYQMDRVVSILRTRWSEIVSIDPLRAYFIATHFQSDECARAAAKATLNLHIDDTYITEMEGASATSYNRLLAYHQECVEAMTRYATDSLENCPPCVTLLPRNPKLPGPSGYRETHHHPIGVHEVIARHTH
ncbi:hypothetical protein B0H21DRAFT_349848 [Amylocystis lapponica]|nr:hypothetical protein B0H21DRAFT_349848 [Amylocystis lapponica]